MIRRALRGTGARFGLAIAAVFLALTVFAPLVAPFDPYEQDLSNALSPPSALHWFGADQYGRDTLSRILYGTRTALLAIVMADGLALAAGRCARAGGGLSSAARVDALVMRLVDVLLAFPYLLLALIIVAALGPSLTNSVIAIGIIYTPQYARLMRGQVLSVKTTDFVVAARADRARAALRVMLRHVLPNSFTPRAGAGHATVRRGGGGDGGTLLPRPWRPAALARLGRAARGRPGYFLTAWWIATFPGLAIFLVVVGFNLLGDAFAISTTRGCGRVEPPLSRSYHRPAVADPP